MMEEILVQSLVGTIILYVFFSKRSNNLPSFPKLYRFRFLAGGLMCLLLLVHCFNAKKPSYYDIIEVDRWAPRGEVIQAIRVAKKKYHPDKNKEDEKTASTLLFYEIQKIETVFNSDTKRNNYNKFGDFRTDGIIEDRNIIMCLILGVAFQVYSSLLGFFLSFPNCFNRSRSLFPVYSIAVFCAELHMRISEDLNPLEFIPFIGNFLPFEKIQFLRSIFPIVLFMSFMYSSNNYRNYDEILNGMLKGNLITNKRIIDLTQSLIIQLQTQGISGGGNSGNSNNNKHKKASNSLQKPLDPVSHKQQIQEIKVDSDNEDESQLEVLQQITEPLKELASTMNDSQKRQLQSVLNIAFSAKLKEKNEKKGFLSKIFGSSFFWILVAGYAFQVLKKYLV